ncbi:hypothetical protein SNE40_018604 [Patella caerulea]|uniref:E3 ubiquitin-protein ligase HACE1 n=1 Tax=Patella caerulea TaxID=87958 RepID=A0AAN8J6M3_PATCE
MEFLQRLAASMKRGRSVALPSDNREAFYFLMPMVISDSYRSVGDLLNGSSYDVNYTCGRAQRTLLHIAANCDSVNCLGLFLKKGATVNLQDISGCTPLHLAARNGQKRCLTKLVEHKSDINIKNKEGLTAIHWLAVNGRAELLQTLLLHIKDVDIEDAQGQTALHVSCRNGHIKTLQTLLEKGASINKTNQKGWTPLHFACSHGQHEIVDILLKRKALLTIEPNKTSPLKLCVKGGYGETCELLLHHDPRLLSHLLQTVQDQSINEDTILKVFNFLITQDSSVIYKLLNGLAEQASLIGHHLLSISTESETDSKNLLKCVRIYNKLLSSQVIGLDSSFLQTAKQQYDTLWQLLEDWLILIHTELNKDGESTGEDSSISQYCSSAKPQTVHSNHDTNTTNILAPTDSFTLSNNDVPWCSGIKENGEISADCEPSKIQDVIGSAFPKISAVIHAFYICCLNNSPSRFMEFCLKHLPILQILVNRNPQIIFQHFHFLLECPDLMCHFQSVIHSQPFQQRKDWFYENLKQDTDTTTNITEEDKNIVTVNREQIFNSSCDIMLLKKPEDLKHSIAVRFNGEEGMGHGVVREWFDVLSREILNPDYALFTQSADGCTFQPNSNSSINPDHLSYFRFAGQILGLALYHKMILNVYFTRSFYKHILGIRVNYTDVASIDPEYAKNLQWILDHNIDELGLDLSFSMETDVFGVMQEVELLSGGKDISVTELNKKQYVQLVTELRMTRAIKPQIDSFLSGFHDYIPYGLVQLFNEYELEILLSGSPEIDLDDWRKNTVYTGFTEDTPLIQWFWQILSDMTHEDRVLLLQFVTGSSRVPYGGFANLGSGDVTQSFTISYVAATTEILLPTASTCINLLKLPNYESKQVLKKNLMIALECGSQGYGLI